MREILFRGKRVVNGEWLFGGFHSRFDRAFIIGCSKSFCIDGMDVMPETVGQFTGLYDRNGKPIYEDDIVQAHFGNNHSKQIFRVVFDDGMFLFDNNYVKVPKYEIYSMKVIGNIHDNADLVAGYER